MAAIFSAPSSAAPAASSAPLAVWAMAFSTDRLGSDVNLLASHYLKQQYIQKLVSIKLRLVLR